jgi:hypothetical protein
MGQLGAPDVLDGLLGSVVRKEGDVMATMESLLAVIDEPAESPILQSLIDADHLTASSGPHLGEGEARRSVMASKTAGYELQLCRGRVATAFIYVQPADGFQAFSGPLPGGLSSASTRRDVLRQFGKPSLSGAAQTVPVLGHQGGWDRFEVGAVCIHFQYIGSDDRIRLVTLMVAGNAPGR